MGGGGHTASRISEPGSHANTADSALREGRATGWAAREARRCAPLGKARLPWRAGWGGGERGGGSSAKRAQPQEVAPTVCLPELRPSPPSETKRRRLPTYCSGKKSVWGGFVCIRGLLWRLRGAGMFSFCKVCHLPWQTRAGGEGHLAVPCLEKAFRQLITAAPLRLGKGTRPDVFALLPAGALGRGRPRRAGGRKPSESSRSSSPSLWVGAGQQVQKCRPSGGPV